MTEITPAICRWRLERRCVANSDNIACILNPVIVSLEGSEDMHRSISLLSLPVMFVVMATPAIARNCSPERDMCGTATSPYTCPPCPPPGIRMFGAPPETRIADAATRERFRESLEGYRMSLDAGVRSGRLSRDAYDAALSDYREGIAAYRDRESRGRTLREDLDDRRLEERIEQSIEGRVERDRPERERPEHNRPDRAGPE